MYRMISPTSVLDAISNGMYRRISPKECTGGYFDPIGCTGRYLFRSLPKCTKQYLLEPVSPLIRTDPFSVRDET